MKNSVETLLKPILHASESKNSKLFASSLSIVKKLVTYNLIKQNHTGAVIQILKDILDNTSEEFMQIKVLETLLPMVNPQTIHLTETLVSNVLVMCLKIFGFKNPSFKNPVSALFKQLMLTTFGFLDNFMRPVIEKRIKLVEDQRKAGKGKGDNLELKRENKETEMNRSRKDFLVNKDKCENSDDYLEENQGDFGENVKLESEDYFEEKENYKEKGKIDTNLLEDDKIDLDENILHFEEDNLDQKEDEISLDQHAAIQEYVNSSEENFEEVNYKVKPSDIDLSEFTSFDIYQTCLSVFKNLILITDGKKKDWVLPTIYSKCLGLELLAGVLCQTGNLFKYLPEFLECITNDLYKIVKKNFETTNDYIMGNKLARISIQIVENLNVCYDLISSLLKYAEYQSLTWQKLIGLECLSSLLLNNYVLKDLYDKKTSLIEAERIGVYDELLITLTKVSYSAVTSKVTETAKKKDDKKEFSVHKHQKLIETSSILHETDVTPPLVSSVLLGKILLECYINYKDSLIFLLEFNNLKVELLNQNFTKEQLFVREMLNHDYESIKNALTALLVNSHDDNTTQNYLNLFQSFINIYGSISLPTARDSYLNDLCKLAIPNNLENSFEMKDKNLLIAKSLFNIAHCVNILDSNSWVLLIETMQKIYLMLINSNNYLLKPNEEFEIDIVIKNLENNMRKYNAFDFTVIKEEKSVLKTMQDDSNSVYEETKQEGLITEEESVENVKEKVLPKSKTAKTELSPKKKGIFSFMKSALGFSKKSDHQQSTASNNNKKNNPILEDNIDLAILSTATDTIFINSKSYDDNTIKNIVKAILASSKSLIDAGNDKNNTQSSEHINTYLHFNLIKLLEISVVNVKRIYNFWETVVNVIEVISSKSLSNISRFSLDVLTIIDLFILTHYNTWDDSTTLEWTRENWQMTIISPFAKIAGLYYSVAVNSNIIYNLSKILQNCGHNLHKSGWNAFMEVCQILIAKSDEILCDNTFKLIEQIVNEYLDYLTPYNISALFNVLESFAIYKKNHNISYSAITMFWNAANIVEKFQKICTNEKENPNDLVENLSENPKEFCLVLSADHDLQIDFFENLWKDLFLKIVNISTDPRFDVRKCAVNIFADIYVAKVSNIATDISFVIINNYFLEILSRNYFIFEEKFKMNRTKKTTGTESATTNKRKTGKLSDNELGDIKIGDYKVDQMKIPDTKQKQEEMSKKSIQPTADEKECEEINILIILAIGKIIKSFLIANLKSDKDFDFYKENFLKNLVEKYSRIMKTVTPDLACAVLKCTQEVYYANPGLFLNSFELIWNIYDEMGIFISSDFYLTQMCGISSSSKMVYNTLEILKEIFLNQNNLLIEPDFILENNLKNLLTFLENLIISSKHSEGIQSINNPQKSLTDEKLIFEFLEKISKILNDYSSWNIYCNFLSGNLSFNLNDLHSEAHLRKSLELFETLFANYKMLNINFVKDYLPKLISQIKDIACLRNKNEYVSVLIKSNKSQMQLWHFACYQLIKILTFIICPGIKKEDIPTGYRNSYSSYNTLEKIDESKEYKEHDKKKNVDDDVSLNEIWDASINFFETIFKQSEGGYKNISRNLLEELLKSCQDMEIQIINFIVNGLLPNSLKIPKEMQIKLLILLDVGSNFDYNTFNLSSQSGSQSSSISRVCISNLFELCKYRSEDSLRRGN